jgi:ABC-2 type transport system ATP-binding protein
VTTTQTRPDATPAAVSVRDLVKKYPRRPVPAVDGLSLEVRPGEVFGFLGPNGAGKSTTIGVLTTRVTPDAGTAVVAGVDVADDPVTARARIGVVPQRNNLDRSLSTMDNLVCHATYHGWSRRESRRRAAELLEEFGLADRARDRVDMFSGGQVQRLMIARALMHDPEVLFLDEPSTGLDPQARLFVWERVRALRGRGVTVVLTTHDMDEAAELSDRIAVVDHGKLLALDDTEGLLRRYADHRTLAVSAEPAPGDTGPDLVAALAAVDGVAKVDDAAADASDHKVRVRLHLATGEDPARLLQRVMGVLTARGAALDDVRASETTLEDVFINLTGRGLR